MAKDAGGVRRGRQTVAPKRDKRAEQKAEKKAALAGAGAARRAAERKAMEEAEQELEKEKETGAKKSGEEKNVSVKRAKTDVAYTPKEKVEKGMEGLPLFDRAARENIDIKNLEDMQEAEDEHGKFVEPPEMDEKGGRRSTVGIEKDMRKQYLEEKEKVYDAEMTNLTHIYALQSISMNPEKIFFKIGMRSMLFLTQLHKRDLPFRFTINPDTDYSKTKYQDGMVIVRGVEKLNTLMGMIGAVYDEGKFRDDPGIMEFRLVSPATKQVVKLLGTAIVAERESANMTFRPKYVYNEMERLFEELDDIINVTLRRDSKAGCIYLYDYAKDVGDFLIRMHEDFQCMENGVKTQKSWMAKFPEQVSRLKTRINRAFRGGALAQSQYARIGLRVAKMEEEARMKFYEKEKVE